MKIPARIWGVVGLLILLHFGLHVSLGFGEGAPDLLAVGVLIGVREVGMGRAAGFGFVLGLLEDAFPCLRLVPIRLL